MSPTLHRRSLALLFLVFVGLTALFWSFPQLDLIVSGWFFDPENVHRFPLMYDPLLRFIQKGTYWVVYSVAALLLVFMLLRCMTRFPLRDRLVARFPGCYERVGVLLLALAMGPGVMVQLATKEVFDRPRPVYTQPFTGPHEHVPPLHFAPEDAGKSFVSGHAAMGFYFAAFAFAFASGRWRWAVYVSGIALGLALGSCRIMQGRHFLSDVLFSGVFTLMVIHLICLAAHRLSLWRLKWMSPYPQAES